ncbi:MAG: hypothetical protein PVH41_12350 [Anaerolineae bacterium]|jgi:hypothetical protein
MREKRPLLHLALISAVLLFVSACGAKDETETWLEDQQDKVEQEADRVARDIEDFFNSSGSGGCAAAPLALSGTTLALVLARKRSTTAG